MTIEVASGSGLPKSERVREGLREEREGVRGRAEEYCVQRVWGVGVAGASWGNEGERERENRGERERGMGVPDLLRRG